MFLTAVFVTFQGEIGEKGQKVNKSGVKTRTLNFNRMLIWLFGALGRTGNWSQRTRGPSGSTGTKGELMQKNDATDDFRLPGKAINPYSLPQHCLI